MVQKHHYQYSDRNLILHSDINSVLWAGQNLGPLAPARRALGSVLLFWTLVPQVVQCAFTGFTVLALLYLLRLMLHMTT